MAKSWAAICAAIAPKIKTPPKNAKRIPSIPTASEKTPKSLGNSQLQAPKMANPPPLRRKKKKTSAKSAAKGSIPPRPYSATCATIPADGRTRSAAVNPSLLHNPRRPATAAAKLWGFCGGSDPEGRGVSMIPTLQKLKS